MEWRGEGEGWVHSQPWRSSTGSCYMVERERPGFKRARPETRLATITAVTNGKSVSACRLCNRKVA